MAEIGQDTPARKQPNTTEWTEEKLEQIRQLVAEGKSTRQIGAVFGVTHSAIVGIAHRRGIQLGARYTHGEIKWTGEKAERLRRLHAEKFTLSAISDILGESRSSVAGALRRAGLFGNRTQKRTRPQSAPRTYQRPAVITPPPPSTEPPLNIPLLELKSHHCRYPTTDDTPHLFCGHQKLTTSSYCWTHHILTRSGERETGDEFTLRHRAYKASQVAKVLAK